MDQRNRKKKATLFVIMQIVDELKTIVWYALVFVLFVFVCVVAITSILNVFKLI